MTLPEVFDAEAELRANPPLHILYADIMSAKYKTKFRRPMHGNEPPKQTMGSPEELRRLTRLHKME